MGGVLKSLISAKGLNAAWQRFGQRLQALEQGLKQAQEVIDRLPQDYVTRTEYHEVVEVDHKMRLVDHAQRLTQLEGLSSKLSDIIHEDHAPKLQSFASRVDEVERAQGLVSTMAEEMQSRTTEMQEKVLGDLDRLNKQGAESIAMLEATAQELRAMVESRLSGMSTRLQDTVEEMKDFTKAEIERAHAALTDMHSDDDAPSEQQVAMLDFVRRHLVEPLRSDVDGCRERQDALEQDVSKQKEEFTRQIRGAQKSAVDMGIRMNQANGEIKADLETRPKRTEVQKMESTLSSNISEVSGSLNSLQTKVTLKLNEFVDHFGKLHETIDDHEHCLRHHAEEIENRSTKYELLTCQHQVDRCALKDEFNRETTEMKKLLDWQSNKIESFSLMGASQAKKKKKVLRRERLQHEEGEAALDSSADSEGTTPVTRPPKKRTTFGSLDGELANAIPEEAKRTPEVKSEADEESDSDDQSSDHDDRPTSTILRQQLESVAMGLVGLSHLVLRETRLGSSRNAKLIQEKELLEELLNLRHWISSNMAPSGWDPSRLTTVALRCSHPREEELQLPMPQVPLKGILAGLPEELRSARGRRLKSADPPPAESRKADGGVKIAPQLAAKTPFSARAASMSQTLPPLQGLAVAA